MTTVYLIRHSRPFRDLFGCYNSCEQFQIKNEKNILSVEGEQLALELGKLSELKNIDVLYSSNYVRAMSTAKYIAENNNININVDERLGERKFGVRCISELPYDFFEKQFSNWDYKIGNGESLNEASKRMNECFNEIINQNNNKRIVIVSHGTALTSMLRTWCDIKLNTDTKKAEIYFKGSKVFDGNWNCPDIFELEFNNQELKNIKNIRR